MANLPKLARTVAVGSTYYKAGDTPPPAHARKITNPKNWDGDEVPDFDNYLVDDEDVSTGVRNSSAANAGRTGLPGHREPANTETGTGGEGAGTSAEKAETDDGAEPKATTAGRKVASARTTR